MPALAHSKDVHGGGGRGRFIRQASQQLHYCFILYTTKKKAKKMSVAFFPVVLKLTTAVLLVVILAVNVINVQKSLASASQASSLGLLSVKVAAATGDGVSLADATAMHGNTGNTWSLLLNPKGRVFASSEPGVAAVAAVAATAKRDRRDDGEDKQDAGFSLDGYVFNARNLMAKIVQKSRYFNGGHLVFDRERNGKVKRQSAYVSPQPGNRILLVAQEQV